MAQAAVPAQARRAGGAGWRGSPSGSPACLTRCGRSPTGFIPRSCPSGACRRRSRRWPASPRCRSSWICAPGGGCPSRSRSRRITRCPRRWPTRPSTRTPPPCTSNSTRTDAVVQAGDPRRRDRGSRPRPGVGTGRAQRPHRGARRHARSHQPRRRRHHAAHRDPRNRRHPRSQLARIWPVPLAGLDGALRRDRLSPAPRDRRCWRPGSLRWLLPAWPPAGMEEWARLRHRGRWVRVARDRGYPDLWHVPATSSRPCHCPRRPEPPAVLLDHQRNTEDDGFTGLEGGLPLRRRRSLRTASELARIRHRSLAGGASGPLPSMSGWRSRHPWMRPRRRGVPDHGDPHAPSRIPDQPCADCLDHSLGRRAQRLAVPRRVAFWLLAFVFTATMLGTTLPTPLYVIYQAQWHFSRPS